MKSFTLHFCMLSGTDMQNFFADLRSCEERFSARKKIGSQPGKKKENPYQIRTVLYQITQVPYHF